MNAGKKCTAKAAGGANPGFFARLVVGILGSSVVVTAPVINWINSVQDENAKNVAIGFLFVLGFAWCLSVFLTSYMKEDHILKCLFTSLGLPGIIISLSLFTQAIQ